ncbi:MAG: cytochrome b/b6 domain-containing protein [Planctomycetes bacterium]|nr:cytochrome b/b6 domain-containing protein [Planctomycetota bacterium]
MTHDKLKTLRRHHAAATSNRLRGCPLLTTLVTLLFLTRFAHADDRSCTDCHSTGVESAPVVTVPAGSAHADLACADCHSARESFPHDDGAPPVSCADCHSEEDAALRGSAHLSGLVASLTRAQKGTPPLPAALCLSCHGGAPHDVRRGSSTESATHRTRIAATCLVCHAREGGVGPHVSPERYLEGVHEKAVLSGKTEAAVCTDCHGSHAIDPGTSPASPVHSSKLSATCGRCHPKPRAEYEASIHWQAAAKGVREAPVCTGCHGEHAIRSRRDDASATAKGNVTKTCSSCHASERMMSRLGIPTDRVATFEDSFHGLSGRLGDLRVASCASCHEHHDILPSTDPASSIHGERPSHWLIGFVRRMYRWLIAIVIGGMLLHNGLDLLAKARGWPAGERAVSLDPCFTVNERIQHALLAGSFIALAASGFALAFPESAFAWPWLQLEAGPETRKWVHRIAAIVLMGLALGHGLYLLRSPRGRLQIRALWPRLQDLRDFRSVATGLLRRPPAPIHLPHYTYAEKMEYFAVIWGTIVMAVTGLALWAVDSVLARFPFWVTDLMTTIHFWEAVLACLAILCWHGYWVVFDPEVYPLSMKWWTGGGRKKDE